MVDSLTNTGSRIRQDSLESHGRFHVTVLGGRRSDGDSY